MSHLELHQTVHKRRINRSPVRRNLAEKYILTSLISFAVTVIVTRTFLQLTGYPQIGNSVLHIAHALWGGLLLIVASFLPLAYANRWAIETSAILSGLGIGLFIDEVGKFITQANDYFFPPALPLIYGFVLLIVLVYLYFRQPRTEDPRVAMYYVLERLQDILNGDLDAAKADRIEMELAHAGRSKREEVVALANILGSYLQKERENLPAGKPDLWTRISRSIETMGLRFGRRRHRMVISMVLIGWVILVMSYITLLILEPPNVDPQVLQWRLPLIIIQVTVGVLLAVAVLFWLIQREDLGLKFGTGGFLVSLIALQLHYFYLSQFSAITATVLQFFILQIL
ncbi:MAG: hypothetical protein QNJ45_26320, partial [Ardenticatenaceae bacterium]|nr:hypothetical protein [Ardenticatenaceae bacterium]